MTPALPSFDQIVREQRDAIAAALRSQADHTGASLSQDLSERLAAGAVTGGAPPEDLRAVHRLFHETPPLALVAFDTPGVHEYVFRVRRPVDVAGGSAIVAGFTDPERAAEASKHLKRSFESVDDLLAKEGLPTGSLVFAGGGRGCLVVAAHLEDGIRSELEKALPGVTHGDLKTVTAAVPVWPEDLSPETDGIPGEPPSTTRYAAALSVLMGRLSRERSRREAFGETVEPRARRCAACRHRVATEPRSGTGEWICRPCSVRRTLGGLLKKDADEAKTFEDLVPQDDPGMAVLYADGANVGAAFQEIDSLARHRALSLAVESAFGDAVEEIRSSPELRDADETLLCQAPIRGGDDAVLILPSFFAFTAARKLVRAVEARFEIQANPLLRDAFRGAPPSLLRRVESFGVGVGIAIGDAHFPVSFLVRYAEGLLKNAKKLIHERLQAPQGTNTPGRSAVDFLVLASGNPLSESITQLRRDYFKIKPRGGEPGLLLTERPYSIDGFERLIEDAAALQEVPPTQRFAVRQEVLRGFALSRSFWRYQHARSTAGEGWAGYRRHHRCALAAVDDLLWRTPDEPPDSGNWKTTSYLDALEALDFLPPSHRPAEARR